MSLMKMNPTSPGRRGMVRVVTPNLHKGAPVKALLDSQSNTGGRNCYGRITTRHRGGGSRQHYRLIDFKRMKDGVPGKVERLEYDPNLRTSRLFAMPMASDATLSRLKACKLATWFFRAPMLASKLVTVCRSQICRSVA